LELQQWLENHPDEPEGGHLLMQIYFEHLSSPKEALDIVDRISEVPHLREAHVKIVDLAVDIMIAMNLHDDAVPMLE
jgi:hypothetical protein